MQWEVDRFFVLFCHLYLKMNHQFLFRDGQYGNRQSECDLKSVSFLRDLKMSGELGLKMVLRARALIGRFAQSLPRTETPLSREFTCNSSHIVFSSD